MIVRYLTFFITYCGQSLWQVIYMHLPILFPQHYLMGKVIASPEADPELKFHTQVIYLGSAPR